MRNHRNLCANVIRNSWLCSCSCLIQKKFHLVTLDASSQAKRETGKTQNFSFMSKITLLREIMGRALNQSWFILISDFEFKKHRSFREFSRLQLPLADPQQSLNQNDCPFFHHTGGNSLCHSFPVMKSQDFFNTLRRVKRS